MIKVQRLYPFEYYSIRGAKPKTNNIIFRVAIHSINLINNLFKIAANIVIGSANLLRLYRLTKVEIVPQQSPVLLSENKLNAVYMLIFSKLASSIIGVGRVSNFGMEMVKAQQARDKNMIAVFKNRLTVTLFGEKLVNTFLQNLPNLQLLGFFLSNKPIVRDIYQFLGRSYIKIPLAIWSFGSILNSSYKGIKTCYDNAYRNPVEAAKAVGLHCLNIFAAISAYQYDFQPQPQPQQS